MGGTGSPLHAAGARGCAQEQVTPATPPSGVCTQPVLGSTVSVVQASPSSHDGGGSEGRSRSTTRLSRSAMTSRSDGSVVRSNARTHSGGSKHPSQQGSEPSGLVGWPARVAIVPLAAATFRITPRLVQPCMGRRGSAPADPRYGGAQGPSTVVAPRDWTRWRGTVTCSRRDAARVVDRRVGRAADRRDGRVDPRGRARRRGGPPRRHPPPPPPLARPPPPPPPPAP